MLAALRHYIFMYSDLRYKYGDSHYDVITVRRLLHVLKRKVSKKTH